MRGMLVYGWAIAMLAAGCEGQDVSSTLAGDAALLDFQGWCADWGLDCESMPSDSGVSAEKLKAGLAIKDVFLDGPSRLKLGQNIFSHPDLKTVLGDLKLEAAFWPLIENLEASGFDALEIHDGRGYAEMIFPDPQPIQGASGIWVRPEGTAQVGASPEGALTISGLSLADPSQTNLGTPDVLLPGEGGALTMQGQDLAVTNIPQGFLPAQLGLDLEQMPDGFDGSALIGALPALANVLFVESNVIQLDQNFWRVVLAQLDTLMDDGPMRANMRVIADSLDQVAATIVQESHGEIQAQFKDKQTIACQSDGRKTTTIKLDTNFGIERLERLNDDAIRLTFFGTKVKSKIFGPIAPTFTLKRMDIYADKIIVRDVPVVGSYTIDLGKPSDGDDVGQFSCAR